MPNWWPFKQKDDPQTLYAAAKETIWSEFDAQQARGVSRQAVLQQIEQQTAVLMDQQAQTPDVRAKLQVLEDYDAILRPQVMQNLSQGKAHEIAGRVDEAVVCFETAVTDQVTTRFPFEHLRVIYVRRKEYAEALRICQAAVTNPHLSARDHEHFQKWIDKLTAV